MQRWTVLLRDDATTKDDDVIKAGLDQFLAHLREQVGVGTRKGGKSQETGVFVPNGVDDLLRGTAQTGVDDLRPASRSALATTFAPRSCPSRPGLATTMRSGWSMKRRGGSSYQSLCGPMALVSAVC